MRDFKIGDTVMIRLWEDMEEEFGLDSSGYIDCLFSFTDEMERLCGETATITNIRGEDIYIRFNDRGLEYAESDFMYSSDMLVLLGKDDDSQEEEDDATVYCSFVI